MLAKIACLSLVRKLHSKTAFLKFHDEAFIEYLNSMKNNLP